MTAELSSSCAANHRASAGERYGLSDGVGSYPACESRGPPVIELSTFDGRDIHKLPTRRFGRVCGAHLRLSERSLRRGLRLPRRRRHPPWTGLPRGGSLHTPGPGAVIFILLAVVITSVLAHRDRRFDRRASDRRVVPCCGGKVRNVLLTAPGIGDAGKTTTDHEADRDRLITLRKAKKKLIIQQQEAQELRVRERWV